MIMLSASGRLARPCTVCSRATAIGRGRRATRILLTVVIIAPVPFLAETAAAGEPFVPVAQGPVVMSEAEKSFSPDPGSDRPGAVVLLEEGEEHDLVKP